MPGWLRSLTGQIVAVTVVVALVAVVVTALVSLQLIRVAVDAQARSQLHSEVVALGRVSPQTARLLAREVHVIDPSGGRFAVIGSDGAASGAGARFVPRSVIDQALSGRSVSETVSVGGDERMIAAVPTTGGGAVVGVRKVADVRAADAAMVPWIVIALLIGLVAAVIAGVLLARRIARPVVRGAAAARSLALGDRNVEFTAHGIRELDDLTTALRRLDQALAVSEARQREFLLSVSHEMRTPLTAIRGYAEALEDGVVDATEAQTVGRTLGVESQRLDRFVSDLLELARLDADDFPIERREVDLAAVVESASLAWSARAEQAGIVLQCTAVMRPAVVVSDVMRVRQVLDGLIENALRVTPTGGTVTIEVGRAATGVDAGEAGFALADGVETVAIEVRDSGPGLTEDDARVAFERGALRTRYAGIRPGGTGLGLSIAARLVERLGGRIAVGPAPEGGACFRVELPREGAQGTGEPPGRSAGDTN
jgi:Signal transduction histidine kinase